jgi:hypothetical protein
MASDASYLTLWQHRSERKVASMNDDIFAHLYPELTDNERHIAREALDRYLELAWELYEATQLRDT